MEEKGVQAASIADQAHRIVDEIEHVIVGKRSTVEQAVLTLLCDGHLLIEDIPGVGKTTLAKAIARVIGGEFRRVQFTPDLLPADVTGSSVYNQQTSQFEFRPGPIFGNVVLVDEINRATPKTQSSLLEAMEERQVTTDGVTRPLPEPFFVIATQNTVEMAGTYPLPEAQLDRFFARVSLGYPSKDDETAILDSQQRAHPLDTVGQLMNPQTMIAIQAAVRTVFVHEAIREFIVDIVRATRTSNQLLMGASPRGSLYVMRAAQASAAMDGCDYVRPDDVQRVAPLVLGHRVIARSDSRAHGLESAEIISKIVATVPAPVPAPIA
ncbi:MAG: MoxR family ATPase [Fimbriimonadaceae bacterium]|nr:MoxR family ATPase [Fimbriimonadaceae bacterium]